jgi:hypothetical protein
MEGNDSWAYQFAVWWVDAPFETGVW